MNKLTSIMTAVAIVTCGAIALGESVSPLHNPINGLDVDANSKIQARDALLVINVLLRPQVEPLTASALTAGASPTYFWDTSNDNRVTSRDALLVINHLVTAPVPEPSSVVLAGLGLTWLVGYAWRRRRRRSTATSL
jgi:hypothetical protein